MYKIKLLLFLLPVSMVSQSVTGKIYDSESTAKGIQVFNITQNIKIFSDENGNFTIKASVNDSLKFTSLFHFEKFIKLSKEHFDYKLVIELKKIVNELEEVVINEKQKAFDPVDYTQKFNFSLKEDIKNHPYLYAPDPSPQGNILGVFELIFKLLKKKKPKEPSITYISYKSYDSLFSIDRFFNKKMLKEDLQIPDTLTPLFFDYCDAQNLNSKLLEKQNQFILLDSLMNFRKDFKTIIDSSKKE